MANTSKKSARTTTKTSAKTSTKSSAKRAAKSSKSAAARTTRRSTSSKKVTKRSSSIPKTSMVVEASHSVVKKDSAKPARSSAKMQTLRRTNLFVGVLHAAQAVVIVMLAKANAGLQGVSTSYQSVDTMASAGGKPIYVTATRHLFDTHLAWIVAGFLGVAALAHFSWATWYQKRYEREVEQGTNSARWVEFGIGGGIMLIAIGMISGITDLATLLAIFAFAEVAAITALLIERAKQHAQPVGRVTYKLGWIGALMPWLIVALYSFGSYQYGAGGLPKSVYWLYATVLVLSLAVAYNLRNHARASGRWTDKLYAEKVYTFLGLLGKAAVAWQIYASMLSK